MQQGRAIPEAIVRHTERAQQDTALDPNSIADAQLDSELELFHIKGYLLQSIDAAFQGRDVEMAEAFDNVIYLDEQLAKSEHDHVASSYRPTELFVSKGLASHILGNL